MTVTTAILGILSIGGLLFGAGWLVAMAGQEAHAAAADAEEEQRVTAAYNGGKAAMRAVDIAALRRLRTQLEDGEEGVMNADACLLYDVCQALRLSEGEAQHILGASYLLVIEAPVPEVDDERGE